MARATGAGVADVITLKVLAPFALRDAEQSLVRWRTVSAHPPAWKRIQQLLDEQEALWAPDGAMDRARHIASRALIEGRHGDSHLLTGRTPEGRRLLVIFMRKLGIGSECAAREI